MNRLLLGGALIALVLAALLWWSSADTPAAAVVAQAAVVETVVAPAMAAPGEVASAQREIAMQPELEPEPQAAAPAPVAAADAALSGTALSGTLVVIDEQGVERTDLDGELQIVLWRESRGEWHKVEVRAGLWSTTLPSERPIKAISIADLQAGGRRAVPLAGFEGHIPIPADGRWLIRARWPPETLLHVRDRDSGAELDPVLLVAANGWPASTALHPSQAAGSAKDLGPSPVRPPPSRQGRELTRTLFASSPGYAWGKIEINEGLGGERILLLERGGDLEIRILGVVDDPNAVLRMFSEEFSPIFEFKLGTRDTYEVSGIVPGDYRLVAQIGDYWDEPVELGEVKTQVVAGIRSKVELALKAVAAPARVPCAGTLMIPAEWGLADFTLGFELLGTALGGAESRFKIRREQMQSVGDSPTLYAWKAPDVQPGRYEVELSKLSFSVGLDVPEQGIVDARIELPPPTWVDVRCVDDATGLEIEDAMVSWHYKLPEGVSGWGSENAKRDQARDCFRIRAPVGTLLVQGSAKSFARKHVDFDAGPGTNELELRLEKLCGLTPLLRDGETLIPWGTDMRPELEPAEGQAPYNSWSHGQGAITLQRIDPGMYTLKVPPIPGFEPVPDQLVRLEKGVVVEHVIQLVRGP